MRKAYPVFAVLGPLFYAAAVVIGGFMIKDYSHIYNTVSELTASNAPHLPIVQILFALYNLSLVLFGAGLAVESVKLPKARIAAIMIIIIGLAGLAMYFFPQDPRDAVMTFRGKMHIALAGLMSPLTMLAIILAGLDFRKMKLYSFISCAVTFLSGGSSVAAMVLGLKIGGLLERLTIGSFIQWLFMLGIYLYNHRTSLTVNRGGTNIYR
jgi:hypothetical protein